MITRTAEYALRAMLALAQEHRPGPLTADRLADITGTPRNYMSKTLYALAKGGLVRSTRGPKGGFALVRPADAITLAEIAAIFAEPPRTHRCLLGTGPCNPATPCAAHHRWSQVRNAAQSALAMTSLADLLPDATSDVKSFHSNIDYHLSGSAGTL